MKNGKYRTARLSFVIALGMCSTFVGCKSSGFKMPGKSLFASREPDATTLAGSGDRPSIPESPAAKYSPTTIASAAVTPKQSNSTAVASTTPTGAPGGSTGAAAAANGYQTGPYQVAASQVKAPNTAMASATSTPAGSFPSPYGGSYSGTAGGYGGTTTPSVALPTSVSESLTAAANAIPDYTNRANTALQNATNNVANTTNGFAQTASASVSNANQAATNAITNANNAVNAAVTNALPTYPSLPSFPSASAGGVLPNAVTSSHSGVSGPTAGPAFPALPGATSNSGQTTLVNAPSSSAYQGSTTLTGYAPGTTGRSTTYNFGSSSSGSSTTPAPTAPQSFTLPPNTASGPGSPLMR